MYWGTHTDYAPQCPPRLKSPADRDRVKTDIENLQPKLADLRREAESASLLDRHVLQKEYLDAMASEIRTGLAAAEAPYPEYWWPGHQDLVLRAIYDGDMTKADQLIAGVRDRVIEEVSQVEKLLASAGMTREYAGWWRKRAKATAADWQKLLEQRQGELMERAAEYSKTVAPITQMLSGLNDPPVQIGTFTGSSE